MTANDFAFVQKMGLGSHFISWELFPGTLGSEILDAAKHCARLLQKARPSLTRTQALEAVSKGAGMPNWHALQTHAKRLIEDFSPLGEARLRGDSQKRVWTLKTALPMLCRADEGCPPTEQQAYGMKLFAAQVAQAAMIPEDLMLDVMARMNGAPSWGQLLNRKPQDATKPLYQFIDMDDIYGVGGKFVRSDACHALCVQMDDLLDQCTGGEATSEFKDFVLTTVERRPDFLEGMLTKAELICTAYEKRRDRSRIYAEAIERAESLMPKGFKGEVSWINEGNRFYLRLLYNYMIWNCEYGSRSRALTLARKLLRCDPNDVLGVRYFLPVLLVVNKKPDSAEKALDKIHAHHSEYAYGLFVRSLVYAAMGLRVEAAHSLICALFAQPHVRGVIDPKLGEWLIPSSEQNAMFCMFSLVMDVFSGVGELFLAVAADPDVLAAESSVADVGAFERTPSGDLELKQQHAEVALQLARKFAHLV